MSTDIPDPCPICGAISSAQPLREGQWIVYCNHYSCDYPTYVIGRTYQIAVAGWNRAVRDFKSARNADG